MQNWSNLIKSLLISWIGSVLWPTFGIVHLVSSQLWSGHSDNEAIPDKLFFRILSVNAKQIWSTIFTHTYHFRVNDLHRNSNIVVLHYYISLHIDIIYRQGIKKRKNLSIYQFHCSRIHKPYLTFFFVLFYVYLQENFYFDSKLSAEYVLRKIPSFISSFFPSTYLKMKASLINAITNRLLFFSHCSLSMLASKGRIT